MNQVTSEYGDWADQNTIKSHAGKCHVMCLRAPTLLRKPPSLGNGSSGKFFKGLSNMGYIFSGYNIFLTHPTTSSPAFDVGMSGCSPGLGGFPPFLGPSASATQKTKSIQWIIPPSLSVCYGAISYVIHRFRYNIKYKSWKRRIHFGTIASKCFKMVVKSWAPTFLKWNLRQNISKSHLLRASQLPCLCKMYRQSLQFFQDIGSLCSNLGFRSKMEKEIHRNLEIHPGDTCPSKADICFCSWQCTWAYRTAGSTWKGRSREIRKTGIKNCSLLHWHMWILYFLYGCVIDCDITTTTSKTLKLMKAPFPFDLHCFQPWPRVLPLLLLYLSFVPMCGAVQGQDCNGAQNVSDTNGTNMRQGS